MYVLERLVLFLYAYQHHCTAPSLVNFYLKWRSIMKTMCWKCHKELLVYITHFQFLWFMWWKSKAFCEKWSPRLETYEAEYFGILLQRTLASELLWEMVWFYCYEGESKIAFLTFMLWFILVSSLTLFWSCSDVEITMEI